MNEDMGVQGVGGVRPPSEVERLQTRREEERLKKADTVEEPGDMVEISAGAMEALKTGESHFPAAPPQREEISREEMLAAAEGWYSRGFAHAYEAVEGMQV